MLFCCHLQYDPALLLRAEAVSLPVRLEKAARIPSVERRAASLAAGLLLRHALFCRGLGDVPVLTDPDGRPHLAGDPAYVSLSHSGDYAACAVCADPVGVDIQKIIPIRERVVRRFATDSEQEWLSLCPDPQWGAAALWALKESYLKASGRKTEEVFRTAFSIGQNRRVTGPEGWRFSLYDEIEGYCLAVCEGETRAGA